VLVGQAVGRLPGSPNLLVPSSIITDGVAERFTMVWFVGPPLIPLSLRTRAVPPGTDQSQTSPNIKCLSDGDRVWPPLRNEMKR
ncbi:hypothetical protein U1Q18_012313, partial [Sarracenia purpurea var. burkii]